MGRAKDDGGQVEAKQEESGGENREGSREEKLQGRGRGESSQLLLINRGTGPQVE